MKITLRRLAIALGRLAVLALVFSVHYAHAQETPYFVTYTDEMEEPGNADLEISSTSGIPRANQPAFFAPYMEFEYGVTNKWTSSLYVEGQSTVGDSTVFTGWRWENRYKLLNRDHWINPVLYLEYENVNEASRIEKEIEGEGPDLSVSNGPLRNTRDRELEGKLIFSSDYHGWNFSENFTLAKNFAASEGVEFGYALGLSRALSTAASSKDCHFCRDKFFAGLESYGGLGSTIKFGIRDTAQYVAPALAWAANERLVIRASSGIGLTQQSSNVLIRFGITYELDALRSRISKLLSQKPGN